MSVKEAEKPCPREDTGNCQIFEKLKTPGRTSASTAVKGVDLRELDASYWASVKIDSTFFLGCRFEGSESRLVLERKGAIVLPRFTGLPYEPFQYKLYTPDDLLRKLETGLTVDQTIYCDYLKKGEILARHRRGHCVAVSTTMVSMTLEST